MSFLNNLWNDVKGKASEVYTTFKNAVSPSAKPVTKGAAAIANVPMVQNKPKQETIIRVDLGNGITKHMDQNGSIVKVVYDCSKWDGTPSFWPEGTKFEYINQPKPKEKTILQKIDDGLTSVDKFVSNLTGGYVKRFGHGTAGWTVAVGAAFGLTEATAATVGTVALGSVVTGCAKSEEMNKTYEEMTTTTVTTIGGEVIPGNITPEEWANTKNVMLNSVIDAKNSEKPKTADGVGYRYENNGDGTGSIIIKNQDGTDSNIKLGFTTAYDIHDEKTDPASGDYSAVLTLTASPTWTINNSNVVEYINIVGGHPKTSAGDEYSYTLSNGKVVTSYGTSGFTHILGESATVAATSPLGKTQKMLTDIGLLPEMNGKIATKEKTSAGAYAGKGINFEVVPGDLKQVTTGNPRVKMSFNAIKNHELNIEGKLSVDSKGVVTITADDGTKVTLTKQAVIDIAGDDYNDGISIAVNGKETYRMAKHDETNPNDKRVELAYVEDDGSTDTTTNFTPNMPDVFDGKTAVEESDKYFEEKKTNLEDAYKTAVGSIYANEKLTKSGSATNYTLIVTIHTKSGAETSVKTN